MQNQLTTNIYGFIIYNSLEHIKIQAELSEKHPVEQDQMGDVGIKEWEDGEKSSETKRWSYITKIVLWLNVCVAMVHHVVSTI